MSSSKKVEHKLNNKTERVRSYPRSRSALAEWLRMLTVAGIIGVLYAWRGGASLLFLLIAVGVIMVGGLIVQLSGPRAIKIERTITPVRPIAGSTLLVKVRVNFSARLPLPWLTIADFGGTEDITSYCFRDSDALLNTPTFLRTCRGDIIICRAVE